MLQFFSEVAQNLQNSLSFPCSEKSPGVFQVFQVQDRPPCLNKFHDLVIQEAQLPLRKQGVSNVFLCS